MGGGYNPTTSSVKSTFKDETLRHRAFNCIAGHLWTKGISFATIC